MGDGDEGVASFRFPGTGITGARWLAGGSASSRSSSRRPARRRQASRSPPSAYRIRRVARRPGGPARLRATITSVRWPTTSRPSRIHDRRASSSRMPVASPTAAASPPANPLGESDPRPVAALGGSRTTRLIPARRASAASRPSRSANLAPAARPPRPRSPAARPGDPCNRAGRSMTSRSTARPARSEPAIARPSSGSAGVRTTSHSGLIPRATASTGSSAAVRSSQATIEPAAWASATSRSASVVRPLDTSPRIDTPMPRGRPPGPRMASSSANPVEKRPRTEGPRSSPRSSVSGSGLTPEIAGSQAGTVASAPTTSPTNPGAAAPQRDRSVARAAFRSVEGVAMSDHYRTDVRMNQLVPDSISVKYS